MVLHSLGIDARRLLKETTWLQTPGSSSDPIEGILKMLNELRREATTEVGSRRWIRHTSRPESIKIRLVIAQQFDVLQRATHTQLTVGDIQDVVGLMIGKMSLQNLEGGINLLGKPKLQSHLMYPGNATEKYTPMP